MLTVITRQVSPRLGECELTHVPRGWIDAHAARAQHGAYEEALRRAGCRVERVAAAPAHPDGVFVEDTALVLAEIAVILRPGAGSRQRETDSVARALSRHRDLAFVRSPGTIDGGDVLRVGSTLFVGASGRTNEDGARQLQEAVRPFGYEVKIVDVQGCLHLKSAVTRVGPNLLLANRRWLGKLPFGDMEIIDVDPSEPAAGNALWIRDVVIFPSSFPATAERLRARGIRLTEIDVSELQKAEGGVTCCCLPLWDGTVDVPPRE